MKNIILYMTLIFCSNALAHNQAENYRYNPFQFMLPEYRFKAESESIGSIDGLPDGYKKVEIHGYRFFVPDVFILQTDKGIPGALAVLDKNNKGLLMIDMIASDVFLCSDDRKEIDKDYCSVFETRRDLLYKSYTLIPDDLSKPEYRSKGYSWIIFDKGNLFEDVSDLKLYERNGFIFFRHNLKPNAPLSSTKTIIMISSPKDDELLGISFFVKDEKLIMDVIKSFQLIEP